MIKTIDTAYGLRREFERLDRDYYSMEGYERLLELYDEDEECDPVGICGEWTEYGNADCSLGYDSLIHDYGHLLDFEEWKEFWESDDEDDYIRDLIDEIRKTTTVFRLSNSVLIAD